MTHLNSLCALGAKPPVYAHLGMILGPDGAQLSKHHGVLVIREYDESGYLLSARYFHEDFDQIDAKYAKKHIRPMILEPLKAAQVRLAELERWGQTAIHGVVDDVAADFDINLSKIGQPIRVAVTGGPVSPPIDVIMWLVGQDRTVRRLDYAIGLIETRATTSA